MLQHCVSIVRQKEVLWYQMKDYKALYNVNLLIKLLINKPYSFDVLISFSVYSSSFTSLELDTTSRPC